MGEREVRRGRATRPCTDGKFICRCSLPSAPCSSKIPSEPAHVDIQSPISRSGRFLYCCHAPIGVCTGTSIKEKGQAIVSATILLVDADTRRAEAMAFALRRDGHRLVIGGASCPGYFIHPSRFGWFKPRADKHDAARQGWERQPRHSFPSHIVGQARVAPGWLG